MEKTSRTFVADLVEQVGSLPTVAAQVVALASDSNCEIRHLSQVILCDNAMTLRFLALANSAAVSFGREIKNLRGALVRLGLRRVRNVALLMGIHDMTPSGAATSDLDMTAFWRYTLATASCAQALTWLRALPHREDDAWLVGILHGIGIAALQQKAGPEFQRALELARAERIPLAEAEMRVLEFHHGELGARLLRQWNLPRIFAETVEFFPEDFSDDEVLPESLPMISVLRDAILIVRTIGVGGNGDADPLPRADELSGLLDLADPALDALAAKVDRQVCEFSGLIGLDMPEDAFAATMAASRSEVARLGLAGLDDSLVREDLERQLASAREIQQRLLPEDLPELEGFDLAAVNLPSLHVSGDTYDFLRLRDGRLALVIADVSGKGMPAALLASTVQASLRALARVFADPGELLAAVNEALYESTDPERFATLFLAALAPDGGSIQYASAGHNPPLLLRSDQTVHWLKPAGTPLGMMPGMVYAVQDVPLAPGDLLVAYTDGITEAVDRHEKEFDEDGLQQAVMAERSSPSCEIAAAIVAAVHAHVGGSQDPTPGAGMLDRRRAVDEVPDAGDDLTLVVLRKDT